MKYTDDFKAEVLAVYEVDGPAAAARLYGVPKGTLRDWVRACGLHTEAGTKKATQAASIALEARRLRIREKLGERAEELLDRLKDERDPQAYRNLTWSFGVLFDKTRLEAGEATERTEAITMGAVEREIARLEAEMAAAPG